MKKGFLFIVLLFSICSINTAFCQQEISVETLLNEMTNTASVARWPMPQYKEKQFSSYDRKSVAADKPGWFANGDFNQFVRKEEVNGHTEYVMMDADGPGAIVRFWLTTVVKQGTIRFYLDNAATPAIEVPAFDLMKAGFNLGPALLNPHSSYEPNGKGGNTLYLPLPYQKHCKITLEFADSASAKTSHYYQINYRTYTAGIKVKTFSKADLTTYHATIDKAEKNLWVPPMPADGSVINKHGLINSNNELSFNLPTGSSAIKQLTIKVKPTPGSDMAIALRNVILKIMFDGEQTVYCPLGDFAGSGYGGKPVKSWYRELDASGQITSRWVMPYQKTATVTIINKSPFAVDVVADVAVDKWTWESTSMYFHATYKYGENIKDAKWDYDVTRLASADTAAPIEWGFISIKGKGIYLGNTLAVNNHMNSWYGEGDAKVWVDDEGFPSEFGTGLEDYYNTSWAPVVIYQTPFANAPMAENESSHGYNTFTRTRNLDGIIFTKSFRYTLEMLSWDGGTIDAAATVYWYGVPGATAK